ncbi:hypothetical protein Misp01_03340 [Microtetraspora sp. NBRC 13810]|uniref:hypothetical protein n=1 Tax=Microtetraspora sp. NBRC 13810 TaxID=3030990 RepID=UPI0024A37425|nr:hypothetical protein [Microtetraspora sp. NBRC 13810]GLW05204.1 hypothetical protein Misp01_03340 [Microtetraspora sp. NBRC 13810]
MLSAGVALYFAGDYGFRRVLGLRRAAVRGVVAVAALPAAAAGLWSAMAQLATLVLLLAAMLAVEHRRASAAEPSLEAAT